MVATKKRCVRLGPDGGTPANVPERVAEVEMSNASPVRGDPLPEELLA